MYRFVIFICLFLVSSASAQELPIFTTTNTLAAAKLVAYYSNNISTNVPEFKDRPWEIKSKDGVLSIFWYTNPIPSQVDFENSDPNIGQSIVDGPKKDEVINNLNSNNKDRAFFEAHFWAVNQIRDLKGQGPITRVQFRKQMRQYLDN